LDELDSSNDLNKVFVVALNQDKIKKNNDLTINYLLISVLKGK
jgi:hypothetical protein